MRFIDPKTDFAFKKIFASDKNKNIPISFLNAIIYDNTNTIKSLTIIDPANPGKIEVSQDSFLDVKALLDNGTTVIIEMQVIHVKAFEKRVVYNLAKAYGNQLGKGEKYPNLRPYLALTITDFVLFPDSSQMINKFRFKEDKLQFNYRDELSLIFLELPKFDKELSELETLNDKWIYFLKDAPNLEVIPDSLGEVPEIEEALNIANRASLTREELDFLERQEMVIEDNKGGIIFAQTKAYSEIILLQLQHKFGEIPREFKMKMEDLSVEQFKLLEEEVLGFKTLEEVENWLNSQLFLEVI
ncbi:Rpn family recombination-promoting nuclease/putative transposase [Okeania sp.]|uniref:Rpn family recombination-promoting nuclease/putative transposase n=1 Tax=Okeania sp. TaxID=3100323 RepID=UPI002B4AC802|nr:Rpn family recombination-promoting nuclease/putative transposase [Okeania sp.]MEB3340581.1 Rpn family recombination-promoting nuclease/putative transposase [Okeania sp.]